MVFCVVALELVINVFRQKIHAQKIGEHAAPGDERDGQNEQSFLIHNFEELYLRVTHFTHAGSREFQFSADLRDFHQH